MANKKSFEEFVGFAGDNLVKAIVNEKLELIQIDFQEFDYDPDEAYILGEMIVIAVNNALTNAKNELETSNTKTTGK